MVTLDDLAAAVKARFDAGTDYKAAAPGGMWFGRANEGAAVPYGVFTLEAEGPAQRLTDGTMVQNYALRVGVYSDQGVTDPQAIQLGMAKALPVTGWVDLRDGKVVHCLPRPFTGKFDPQLRSARDVFLSQGQWLIQVAGATTP